MVKKAEKAGFNPLTAIRNGGSAGFTSTTTQGPGGLSAALSAAGNFLQNFDPFADAKRSQESRLVDAQIANLNAQTGSYNRTASSPSGPVARGTGVAAVSGAVGSGPIEAGKRTATNPFFSGVIDGRFPDADAWETRYSDMGGWIGGAINVGVDMRKSLEAPDAPGFDNSAGRAIARGLLRMSDSYKPGVSVPDVPWLPASRRNVPPSSGNLPAGNNFQLPPLWPTYGAGPLGGY